jgi:hypothetical protein
MVLLLIAGIMRFVLDSSWQATTCGARCVHYLDVSTILLMFMFVYVGNGRLVWHHIGGSSTTNVFDSSSVYECLLSDAAFFFLLRHRWL